MTEPKEIAAAICAVPDLAWGIRIPVRDGVSLGATLYRPAAQAKPAPAIFALTPYIGQAFHDEGIFFATHGYSFLSVDVRGRGDSEGTFTPYLDDPQDGFDVVEWVARQPWCNGKVAMWGGSYSGANQWTTAAQRPPHLTTIVPVASPFLGVDVPFRNNIGSPYIIQWLTLVSGRASQKNVFSDVERFWAPKFRAWVEAGTAFEEIDRFCGNPSSIFQEWTSHPHRDGYWDQHNPTSEQYARLSIPILTMTGAYDADQPGALTHYQEHQKSQSSAPHYLVIGPWDHVCTRTPKTQFAGLTVGPASVIDTRALHLEWYEWTLRSGPKPAFLQKPVAYYVTGSEKWRYADTLEAVTSHHVPLFLHSRQNATDVFNSGSLTGSPEISAPDQYIYDPCDISLAALDASVDPENVSDLRLTYAAAGRQLIYHTEPFQQDIEISGFFRFVAWLALDQPDTDFKVAVYDIGIDGSGVLLSTDLKRARFRESLREAKLIRTQTPLQYDFNAFTFVSRLVRRGHRVRLIVGPVTSIFSERNYNSGGVVAAESRADAHLVTVKLYHDLDHPSALYVPHGVPES